MLLFLNVMLNTILMRKVLWFLSSTSKFNFFNCILSIVEHHTEGVDKPLLQNIYYYFFTGNCVNVSALVYEKWKTRSFSKHCKILDYSRHLSINKRNTIFYRTRKKYFSERWPWIYSFDLKWICGEDPLQLHQIEILMWG